MNLIERIIKKNLVDDYYFIEYVCGSGLGVLALAIREHGAFYDLDNHAFVDNYQIGYLQPLSAYENISDKCLSIHKAKKIAKNYYDKFLDDFKTNYCKDRKIMENSNNTFYFMI